MSRGKERFASDKRQTDVCASWRIYPIGQPNGTDFIMPGLHGAEPTLRGKSALSDDLECKTVACANLLRENIGPWNGLIVLTILPEKKSYVS